MTAFHPTRLSATIHLRNKSGTYQREYVASPNRSTSHQSTSRLRIHSLYSFTRNLCGKTFVPAASKIQSGDLVLITLATRNLPVQNFSLAFTPMVIATGGEQLKKL